MYPSFLSGRRILSALTAVCVVIGLGLLLGRVISPDDREAALAKRIGPRVSPARPRCAAGLLGSLAAEFDPAMSASRAVLLGRRDPAGPSCVQQPTGAGPVDLPKDPRGGPGTRIAAAYYARSARTAREVYRWQQTAFRDLLGRLRRDSDAPRRRARRLARQARLLSRELRAWPTWQEGLAGPPPRPAAHWPGHCLQRLGKAVADRDLPACRHWADELAGAAFALADLHDWLDLLLGNHLAALDFQARCEELFDWADPVYGPGVPFRDDLFPATCMALARFHNYYEVERQAEGLFRVAADRAAAAAKGPPEVAAAAWMPPELRESFLVLRGRLSPTRRSLWDRAAATPFERSYLANMLFRASRAGTIDEVSVALRRFDRSGAEATIADLMDVIFYRAGTWDSARRWSDRYDGRLMRSAGGLAGTDEQVLRGAHATAWRLVGGPANYQGGVWTLKEALDTGKLDCVRAADMIGGLFRNAGRAGYYAVRLTGGLAAHTVAAADVGGAGEPVIALADSLRAPARRETWPAAYFRARAWPEGYPGVRGPLFAAELTARGLDSYVFAEGYVIMGTHAGLRMRAALPYLPGRRRAVTGRAHAGPYPRLPVLRLQGDLLRLKRAAAGNSPAGAALK